MTSCERVAELVRDAGSWLARLRGMRSKLVVAVLAVAISPRMSSAQPAVVADLVPDACRPFAHAYPDPAASWNQLVSLAACAADDSRAEVWWPYELRPATDGLQVRLLPALAMDALVA